MKNKETKITFSDYDEEGLFVYNLSKIENKNPYLICVFSHEEKNYRKFNNDTEEYEGNIWFEDYVKKLKVVAKFQNFFKFIIYEVTDMHAYLNLWSKTSDNCWVAESTISGNCNLDEIIKSIIRNNYYDDFNINFDYKLANWVYTQRYGGGCDEHHAVFYSSKVEYVEFIKGQVEKSKESQLFS